MDISPEEKLIFICLRIDRDINKQKEIIASLKAPIDWNRVIILSRQHKIAALLYHNLNSLSHLSYIPEETLQILKRVYFTNLYRNITRWEEFGRVLDLAKEADIKILPFKGIILSRSIYRDPALRIFTDIDVLVKEKDLSKFRAILLNRGYEEVREKDACVFIKLINPGLPLYLELHTMFVPPRPYAIQIPQLWQRVEHEIIDGRRIDCLSREDTFLSLALHLRRHTRILIFKFIYDIAGLLDLYRYTLDWKYLEDLARKNHIKNCIYFCLYISKELSGVSVAGEIIDKFSPRISTKRLMYFCMNKHNFLKPGFWQGFILRILLFDRAIDLFIYLLQMPTRRTRPE